MKFAYPHPLISQGSGRIKTDPENQRNIELVFKRYREWIVKTMKQPDPFLSEQHKSALGFKIYPLVGLIIGVIGTYAFVHKSSKFIGPLFTIGTVYGGYLFAERHQQSYNNFKYFARFPYYPTDIKKMIDNNDARYAHRWLNDNYLQNKDD